MSENNSDSDYEIISGNSIVTTGYKPLREEVETVIINHTSDENDRRNIFHFDELQIDRMEINSSYDKIVSHKSIRPYELEMFNIKKSKSANFSFKNLELKSPSLVRKNEVFVKNQTPKTKNKLNIIYDIPKTIPVECDQIIVDEKLGINR